MADRHILVVGDTILDETIYSNLIGVSLETPTLKAQYDRTEVEFGGASNVVENILTLGGRVTYVTVGGADKYTENYKNWATDNLNLFFIEEDKENTVKTRYWVNHGDSQYKQLQINSGLKEECSNEAFEKLLKICGEQEQVDCVLLVDYSINIFSTPERAHKLLEVVKKYNKPIIVSSQLSSNKNKYPWFSGVDFMCMNITEASANIEEFEPSDVKMKELANILQTNVCVTLGDQGALFNCESKTYYSLPYKVKSVDSCGAGDAFVAAFSIFCESGNIDLCNKWAALSTTEFGTKCPPREKFYEH